MGALWGFLVDCLTGRPNGDRIICFSLSTWAVQPCRGPWISTLPWRTRWFFCASGLGHIVGMELLRGLTDGRRPICEGCAYLPAGSAIYTAIIIAMAECASGWCVASPPQDAVVAAPTVSNKWRMLTE